MILDAATKCHVRFRLGGDVSLIPLFLTSLEIPPSDLLQDLRPRVHCGHQRLRTERLRENQEGEEEGDR